MGDVPFLLAWLTLQLSTTSAPAGAVEPIRVCLITLGPGDAPWERSGHNMLWIHDPQAGIDTAYNWGMFQFEKGFIWNFIQGRLSYWMEGVDVNVALDVYRQQDRTIWVQELNLSPAQRKALLEFCQWNEQPKNKYYKYDYYVDNCSTRVRDALDVALAGQIKRRASTMPSDLTYRSETNRLMSSDPLIYTGIYAVLGQPIDRKITAWDEMFIPMRMRERVNELTIVDEGGAQVPLVRREVLLHKSNRPPTRTRPPNWAAWFGLAGLILGAGMAWCARLLPQSRLAWWGFAVLAIFWAFQGGFGGATLLYFWAMTDHTWARQNENLLQLSPLLLPLVILLPLALRRGRYAATMARWLATIALVGAVVGLVLKVLPAMDQANANMIALALPANTGLAWALWKLKRNEASA